MRRFGLVLVLGVLVALVFACKEESKDTPSAVEPEVKQAEVVAKLEPVKPDLPSELITANYMSLGLEIEKTTLPTLEELKTWNAQFKRVTFDLDTSGWTENDVQAVQHFVAAAEAIDEIFWMQNSVEGLKYRDMCRNVRTLTTDVTV